jgi:hypothetical protein
MLTFAFAGCADFFNSKQLAHEVELFNRDDKSHNIIVRVENSSKETIYEREFHLKGGYGEEGTDPFRGTPTTVFVAVDDSSPTAYPWPDFDCEEERGVRSAGGAIVTLSSEETIHLYPSCNTVYAE